MLPIINLDSCSASSAELERVKSRRVVKTTAAPEWFTCSQQSILYAMDRFVKSVHNMDATVLVPSRLRDMETTCSTSKHTPRVPSPLANADLHSFYLMLNNVKKELLWGPGTVHPVRPTSHGFVVRNNSTSIERTSSVISSRDLKHSRQSSDDSLGSLGSTASSTSDTDSEADSLMTDRDNIDDHTSHLSVAFRHHLQGLHSILHQLADSADYLSSRYQEEIDSSM